MSAPQASNSANNKSLAFAGVLNKVLLESGYSVDWTDPNINLTREDLDAYDSVIVGISPITSLSANRAYGALHIIDLLWDSPKLKLFIDAPQVNQITFSINSIISNPSSFTKSFFSYRKDFNKVTADEVLRTRLLNCIYKLGNDSWPSVLYPSLPWSDPDRIKKLLPKNVTQIVPINLDSYLLEDPDNSTEKREKWVIDNYKTDWVKSTVKSLVIQHFPMKWNKGWTDIQVFEQISRSLGVLITPYKKDGTWWSYRYIQALNSSTPIATEWKESSRIGTAWTVLASSIEAMSPESRKLLAMAQRDLYVSFIPGKEKALTILKTALGLNTNKEK